ncbi:MAG TPA: PDDEXK nuclease domain-containing protein [Chitinispirillaceae bacterium]|nr:PDDEXK nuclease domain-containing protein [Chitinispirillaceae bacterium]
MTRILRTDKAYAVWLKELKNKIRSVQIKAAVQVNTEMLNFYWDLGAEIVEKQASTSWGDGFLSLLSKDLTAEFPEMKGFSERNLRAIRQWYLFYSVSNQSTILNNPIRQQPVAKLVKHDEALIKSIPWGHNVTIIGKCRDREEALYYVSKTIQNNWSRAVLRHHIESGLYHREGKSINNFKVTLPKPQSDLARQTLKDPYTFDFLTLREMHDERELEDALLNHVTNFLLELGSGFSYLGRQYRLTIDGEEFFIDLLLYHVRLHCYVVVELKAVKFKPEFTGKLNFYISAVDGELKMPTDNPTIGILICKSKTDTVVEYALKDIHKPIGVSEYTITKNLPEEFKSSLPSIEEIEAELDND